MLQAHPYHAAAVGRVNEVPGEAGTWVYECSWVDGMLFGVDAGTVSAAAGENLFGGATNRKEFVAVEGNPQACISGTIFRQPFCFFLLTCHLHSESLGGLLHALDANVFLAVADEAHGAC